jgi:hypothetical protein
MNNVGEVVIKLRAETEEFDDDLDRLIKKLKEIRRLKEINVGMRPPEKLIGINFRLKEIEEIKELFDYVIRNAIDDGLLVNAKIWRKNFNTIVEAKK